MTDFHTIYVQEEKFAKNNTMTCSFKQPEGSYYVISNVKIPESDKNSVLLALSLFLSTRFPDAKTKYNEAIFQKAYMEFDRQRNQGQKTKISTNNMCGYKHVVGKVANALHYQYAPGEKFSGFSKKGIKELTQAFEQETSPATQHKKKLPKSKL